MCVLYMYACIQYLSAVSALLYNIMGTRLLLKAHVILIILKKKKTSNHLYSNEPALDLLYNYMVKIT